MIPITDAHQKQHSINQFIKNMPMQHLFTFEEMRPSAKTIYFIKQLAYTYRAFKKNESCKAYFIN